MSVTFNENIEFGGYSVSLPTLKLKNANLKQIMNENSTMNFVGDGVGNISFASGSATMSNINVNTTLETIEGSYDMKITYNGNTYDAHSTFNENGCTGADVYDSDGNFVSRVKLFEDGNLYLVDESNNKLDKIQ